MTGASLEPVPMPMYEVRVPIDQPTNQSTNPPPTVDDSAPVTHSDYGATKQTSQGDIDASIDNDEDTIKCMVKRYQWQPPTDANTVPYRPHAGEGSQYLRDFILGVNDGIISTFLLVVGTVGGGASAMQALLTAIAASVAGAIAMGIGEYIATKSQLQVNDGEMKLETEHFIYHRDVELQQLRSFLESVSLSGDLLEAVVSEVGRSDESLMKMMMAFEFGVHAEELERNPFKAMWMSGRLFIIGALPTVLPFCFTEWYDVNVALGIAGGLVGIALFLVGAIKTRTTKSNPLTGGLENMVLGAIATGISYAVGYGFSYVNTD